MYVAEGQAPAVWLATSAVLFLESTPAASLYRHIEHYRASPSQLHSIVKRMVLVATREASWPITTESFWCGTLLPALLRLITISNC